MKSDLEEEFLYHVKVSGLPAPEREAQVIPGRRFRFDFYWPRHKLLVEIQGAVWSKGKTGHNSGGGIERDCEKHNLAVLAGYRVLMFTGNAVHSGAAVDMLGRALK